MLQYAELFMEMIGTRIRVTANLTRMSFEQARLFERLHANFVTYGAEAFQPIVTAMAKLGQEQLTLRGAERPLDSETDDTPHQRLVHEGYLMANQSLVIRLAKDAITLNFGPQSGDNAWEEPLIITIDRVMEEMDGELWLPSISNIYSCFDLLGNFIAAGLVDMRENTHDDVVVKNYANRADIALLRDLGISAEEYLADPVKAKALTELALRMTNRYDTGSILSYSQWPLTRNEFNMWKLDISEARAHVTEIWIDEMSLLHTFHPNAYDLRTKTAIRQIKEAWQQANK